MEEEWEFPSLLVLPALTRAGFSAILIAMTTFMVWALFAGNIAQQDSPILEWTA